jgi:hypothetical protein
MVTPVFGLFPNIAATPCHGQLDLSLPNPAQG